MSIEYQDARERLVAEQAVALLRAVEKSMHAAPEGQGLARMEATLMEKGRTHLAEVLKLAIEGHPEAQKGGRTQKRVRVGRRCDSKATPPRR